MRKAAFFFLASFVAVGLFADRPWQRFYPDDPLWEEPRVMTKKPAAADRSEIIDFLENSSFRTAHGEIVPAANANTVGGVPDSAWFENRIGTGKMGLSALLKGPNQVDGPDMTRPWEVLESKTEGITAGFKAKDGRGDTYFVKLDPQDYPQLTTSAEVISTKFFHAFGYHVPENYLVYFSRNQLRLGKEAAKGGFTQKQLQEMLEKAPLRPDGTYQALASRKIEGEPIGQFKFWGMRPDDPNDIFRHENRRELRALRLFCAWLNHVDIDTINTLDVFIGKEDRGYVKHYLIDFGTTLGSGAFEPQRPRVGHEYPTEWGQIVKSILGLGLWQRPWQKIDYPDYPQIGNFEANDFRPELWRPDYRNPAFDRMRLDDAFWAAAIISQFSDDMVRQVVKLGRISDPEAEGYLIATLIERRDKILRYYLSRVNPVDRFELRTQPGSPHLAFENLSVKAGVGKPDSYAYSWYSLESPSGKLKRLEMAQSVTQERIPLPPRAQAAYLVVQCRTVSREQPEWGKPVLVYLRREESGYRVVGVEREEENGELDIERRRQLAERRQGEDAAAAVE